MFSCSLWPRLSKKCILRFLHSLYDFIIIMLPYNASGEQLWDGCTMHLLTLCKPNGKNVRGLCWCLNELDSCRYKAVLWLWDLNRVCDQCNHIRIFWGINKMFNSLCVFMRLLYCWHACSFTERRFRKISNCQNFH